jgi:hypothetical protein
MPSRCILKQRNTHDSYNYNMHLPPLLHMQQFCRGPDRTARPWVYSRVLYPLTSSVSFTRTSLSATSYTISCFSVLTNLSCGCYLEAASGCGDVTSIRTCSHCCQFMQILQEQLLMLPFNLPGRQSPDRCPYCQISLKTPKYYLTRKILSSGM